MISNIDVLETMIVLQDTKKDFERFYAQKSFVSEPSCGSHFEVTVDLTLLLWKFT